MPTTLFPALLPNTDRADDYTPLKKGDGDDDDAGDPGSEEGEISGTYAGDNESDTAEKPE
jgi:hypothetical protein